MLYYDLIEYYKKEHNLSNEIRLIGKKSGDEYIFRRYQVMFTNTYMWANILTGTLLTSDQVIKYYDLPVIDIYGKYKNLNPGTILQVKNKHGDIEYYKKMYHDDIFIECYINGRTKEPEYYTLEGLFKVFETVKVLEKERYHV